MPYQYPILVCVVVQRLWEVAISRKRLREDIRDGSAQLIREPVFPVMVAVHAGWLAGCWAEVIYTEPPFVAWLVIPMLVVWGASLALRVWMMSALGTLWNVRLISRDQQEIVTNGPYRYIRHPNYLAVMMEVGAIPLMLGAYWTALIASVANGLVLWARIRKEEAYLESIEAYQEAFSGKKRLVPGIF